METQTQICRRPRCWLVATLAAVLLAAAPAAADARLDPTTGASVPEKPSVVVVESTSGFDWSDAAVGAGIAAGVALLAGGMASGLGHRRRLASS